VRHRTATDGVPNSPLPVREHSPPASASVTSSPARLRVTGGAKTHARAVVPSGAVHEQPYSWAMLWEPPGSRSRSPLPYSSRSSGTAPTACSMPVGETRSQNGPRATATRLVSYAASVVGDGGAGVCR
jgi:hypothetical protein